MGARKTTPSSAGPKDSSRFLLPSDLANSLRYLEDSELQRLQVAVDAEVARRKRDTSKGRADEASTSSPTAPRPSRIEAGRIAEIPEGKANLIRASFDAGLKPATMARTFGVSVSLVNRIIRSAKK
jgi:hypothetical protein